MTVDGVRLTTVEQIRVNYAYNFYNMPKEADFMITDRINIRATQDFNDYCYHITQGVNAMVDQPVFEFLPTINNPRYASWVTGQSHPQQIPARWTSHQK